MAFKLPEKFRVKTTADDLEPGLNGLFVVRSIKLKNPLRVIASDGGGWEHVSVSLQDRTPTWSEMAFIKALFWDPEDLVVQMHVPESDHVNCHPFCLHLWRAAGRNDYCERPPAYMVGPTVSGGALWR